MTIIKSFTSLEQSKKLAEFLPLESADMAYYQWKDYGHLLAPVPFVLDGTEEKEDGMFEYIPCWSLTALFIVLPKINNYRTEIRQENNCFCCAYTQKDNNGDLYWYYADNPIDACFNMIIRLHELNLL